MNDKFYPEILLEGGDFSPHVISNLVACNLQKTNEPGEINPRLKRPYPFGSCLLRLDDSVNTEEAIIGLIDQYRKLIKIGLNRLGIEKAIFYLIVETTQNKTTLSKETLLAICECFDEVNISMVAEGQ
jgi:hypothetical protein